MSIELSRNITHFKKVMLRLFNLSAEHGNSVSHFAICLIKNNCNQRNNNVHCGEETDCSSNNDNQPKSNIHASSHSFSPAAGLSSGVFFFPPNSYIQPNIPPPIAIIIIAAKTIFSTIFYTNTFQNHLQLHDKLCMLSLNFLPAK